MQKKRIFTWLTLAASVICLAAFAWANSTPTAEKTIQVSTYEALKAAVNDPNSGDIEIIADIAMGAQSLDVPEGRTVTISIKEGKTLLASGDLIGNDNPVYAIKNSGDLTIIGSGTIRAVNTKTDNEKALAAAVFNVGSGDVTVKDNVKLTAESKGQANAVYNYVLSDGVVVGNIIISGHAKLTATASNDAIYTRAYTVYALALKQNTKMGSVTVSENAEFIAKASSNTKDCDAYAIYNRGSASSACSLGDITVTGNVTLTAEATSQTGMADTLGIRNQTAYNASAGKITVADNVKINAKASGNDSSRACGIMDRIYGGSTGGITVTGNAEINADVVKGSCAIAIFSASEPYASSTATTGPVTVTGNVKLNANAQSENGKAYAVRTYADSTKSGSTATAGTVTIDGNVTANATAANSANAYAISNVTSGDQATSGTTTVTSGNFKGNMMASPDKGISIHGGTFTGCGETVEKYMAPGCKLKKDASGNYIAINGVAVSMDKDEAIVPKGRSATVTVQLISNDESAAPRKVTSLDILGLSALPAGLSVDAIGTTAVKVTNVSCDTEGMYEITITLSNTSGDTASGVLTITTEADPSGDVKTKDPKHLKRALETEGVTAITLSEDYRGYISSKVTAVGTKTLSLNGQKLLLNDKGIIVISKDASLDIIGPGTVSKDEGPIFDVQGSLTLTGGKYYAANCLYFTPKETPAENMALLNTEEEKGKITIAKDTLFWFSDDKEAREDFIADYLVADGLTLVETKDPGWYAVAEQSKGSSSSVGCNAGFAALALLGLAFVPTRRKK